jgi:hypothetical protein
MDVVLHIWLPVFWVWAAVHQCTNRGIHLPHNLFYCVQGLLVSCSLVTLKTLRLPPSQNRRDGMADPRAGGFAVATLGTACSTKKVIAFECQRPPLQHPAAIMGVAKKTRKFAQMKRVIGMNIATVSLYMRSQKQANETQDCTPSPPPPPRQTYRV